MKDELITPENVSTELLKTVLDAAYMDTKIDENDCLIVKENVDCIVILEEKSAEVRLMTVFGFKADVPELKRLQAVNQINTKYVVIRATSEEDDTFVFTWDIPIAGGITKKAFVLALKRFCSIPSEAIGECAIDLVN